MKLAKIIKRISLSWILEDGTEVSPPIGTIVQYTYDRKASCYVVYFPGYTSGCRILPRSVVNDYFKDLTDETG